MLRKNVGARKQVLQRRIKFFKTAEPGPAVMRKAAIVVPFEIYLGNVARRDSFLHRSCRPFRHMRFEKEGEMAFVKIL